MNEAQFWNLLSLGVPALVALAIFVWGRLAAVKDSRQERRRQAVVRILDAIDKLVRAERYPVVSKMWSTREVDIFLAQNRLLLDIPWKQRAVWTWLQTRIVEMTSESRTRSSVEIATEMSGALTVWYRKGRKAKWFAEQNRIEGNNSI